MAPSAPPNALAAEQRALAVSLVATSVLGGGAIVWGVLSGARVILFDGVYMLAGIVLVAVSMIASRASGSAPTGEYPFGRHAATPLAVALQGAALLGTVAYGAVDAVTVMIDGGSDAAAGTVLVYGLVTATASAIVMLIVRPHARVSALARAELVSWRAGLLLSVVVAVGGAVALAISQAGDYPVIGYIDPILVIIACAAVLPMALGLIREGVRELLEAAPEPALRAAIDAPVAEGAAAGLRAGHALPDPIVRATKLGQRLYVEVDFIVAEGDWSVDDEDVIRREITTRLGTLGLQVWATIELTTDPALAAD